MQAYPYKVDYNDHFETPLIAYKDIEPVLKVNSRNVMPMKCIYLIEYV